MTRHAPSYPTGSDTLLCSCGQRFESRDGYLAHWDRMASVDAANVLIQLVCVLAGMGVAFFLGLALLANSVPLAVMLLVGTLGGAYAGRRLVAADSKGDRSCAPSTADTGHSQRRSPTLPFP